MYPQVKVRKDKDLIPVEEHTATNVLRVIESLSIENHCSPRILATYHESDCRKDPSQSQAKVSKTHSKNLLTPSISTSKGKNNKSIDGDNRTSIRPSSVPRPRAVLSSPDNDEIIGNQNQQTRERGTIPKRQNQSTHGQDVTRQQNQQTRSQTSLRSRPVNQNLHARVKPNQMNARVPTLLRTREVVVEDGKHTHTVEKHTPELSGSLKRSFIKRK